MSATFAIKDARDFEIVASITKDSVILVINQKHVRSRRV